MVRLLQKLDADFSVGYLHRLRVTRDPFEENNPTLAEVVGPTTGNTPRVHSFVDQAVADAWPDLPESIERYTRCQGWTSRLTRPVQTVPGGERCKEEPGILQDILRGIHDAGIDRQSYVIVVGGGAVLDVVGYAAAIAHRGVRLIRVPSTTLSQADSGVGVKNSVNAFGKKNYLGTFSPPWAVVNDERLLETLSERDWRSGFAEVVKVGLVKDALLFDEIAARSVEIGHRETACALPAIRRSAELHIRHIVEGGDPFEVISARPLDFGHWAAHKLEQMTHFELRHGEAVAIGLALDTIYSELAGLLDPASTTRILRCLEDLGFDLYHSAVGDTKTLFQGLDEFREHLGGQLTITLLRGVGDPVDVHEIDHQTMRRAIDRLASREFPTP